MTIVNDTIEAGGATPPATVKVWDLFVRVFHWSLVALFVLAYATGDQIEQARSRTALGRQSPAGRRRSNWKVRPRTS